MLPKDIQKAFRALLWWNRISAYIYRRADGLVSIYLSKEQGLDPNNGKYLLVCEKHGKRITQTNLKLAKKLAQCSEDWCDRC